ncbi:MAG: cytochrome bc1 complex diheme cytochrome c subunit [Acidimicrobiales bacterium]
MRKAVLPVLSAFGVTIVMALGIGSAGAARPQPAPPSPMAQIAEGRDLYNESCTSCHGPRGEGSTLSGGRVAPALVGVGEAAVDFYLSTGRMPLANTNDPQAVRKPPAYDPQQIASIVAYVSTFGPGGPPIPRLDLEKASLSRGGELYLLNCAACHNAAAVGGALSYGAFAPDLFKSTATEIAGAPRVGPGNMPVFGRDTLSDEELNDIVRYVMYLQHPEDAGGNPLGHLGPVTEGLVGLLFGLGTLMAFVAWLGTRA